MKYAGLIAIAALGLAACGGGDAPGATETANTPATDVMTGKLDSRAAERSPAAAMSVDLSPITFSDDALSATVTFPDGLAQIAPELAQELVETANNEIEQSKAFANESKAEDSAFFRKHQYDVSWSMRGASGPLISLESGTYHDGGGAHPNAWARGFVYNTETKEQMSVMDLFPDASTAYSVLQPTIATGVTAEKLIRYGIDSDDGAMRAEVEELLPGPETGFTNAVLLPSTEAGKIGGLHVLFPAYELGAYAEGSYEVVVPQAEFAGEVKPEYRALFVGEPVVPEE